MSNLNTNKARLYKQVFGTPEGQKVLKDLMDFCGFMTPSYTPDNQYNTAFNEGRRRVLLRILSFMKPQEAIDLFNNKTNLINYEDM
tara:strand:- start:11728 stop:11985 length:258 start_codon:yes stop_codon:yes gene_type:complete